MKKIVVVTSEYDRDVDPILVILRNMGHVPHRLHPSDVPLRDVVDMRLEGSDLKGIWRTGDRNVRLDDIGAIWWRKPASYVMPENLSQAEQSFIRGETDQAMRGLWHALNCYWMSFPLFINQAGWKLGQLRRAASLGFETPRTLITNEPSAALKFCDDCGGNVIYKTLSDPTLGMHSYVDHTGIQKIPMRDRALVAPMARKITYTTFLCRETLLKHLNKINGCFCQFQECIERKLEYRVTIIGGEIFCAQIVSKSPRGTRVDWRRMGADIELSQASLPRKVHEQCLAFVRSYGLNYSAMDLILTPEDRLVFIENNPNGQCGFIEELVPELRMSEAIAQCLIDGLRM